MGPAIKAEFRKFFTTRMWWGMAIPVFVTSAGLSTLFGFISTPEGNKEIGLPPTSPFQFANSIYTSGASFGYLFTLSLGVLMIGSEYRHKTISVTFLSTPKRVRVMLAKVTAMLGIGGLYGIVFLIASVGIGGTVIASRGFSVFPEPGQLTRSLLLLLLALGLWGLIGLGAGILIPNQIAALLIMIGFAFILEPAVGALLTNLTDWGDAIVKFLPGNATSAMLSSVPPKGSSLLGWWQGGLVLVAYAAVMAGIGSFLTVRRDIS